MTRGAFFDAIKEVVDRAGVFAEVRTGDDLLECRAQGASEPAYYRVFFENGAAWVALVTKDRWLSESIEADLMHTGDPLEELLEEELADQGFEGETPGCEHFRSEDMMFTFRSKVPGVAEPLDDSMVEPTSRVLLAYEACFRQLGDMSGE